MAAATRSLFLTCFHSSGSDESGHLTLRPRYPSMPRRPRAAAVAGEGGGGEGGSAVVDLETAEEEEEEKVAVFAVSGMTCAACAGSVEKAVKRLPGIHEAAVDVLGGRVQVAFYTAFVSVSIGCSLILRLRAHLFCLYLFRVFSWGRFQMIRSIGSSRHIIRCLCAILFRFGD